jgi:signal peptidase I
MSVPGSGRATNSLRIVTDLERPPARHAGADLNAQIRARVQERRRAQLPRREHVSVAQLKDAQREDAGRPAQGSEVPPAPTAVDDRLHPAVKGRGKHGLLPRPPGRVGKTTRLVGLLLMTLIVVFGLRSFVIASYYIPSSSMETTLHGCVGCQPDMVLVDKLSYRFTAISRTDVVVFDRPSLAPPEDKQLIKRVIGLPGDTVSGHDGHVFVNNKQLTEPYVNPACHGTADFAAVKVPAGRYFMMGDNRCNSFDSRMFGTISRSAVIGRAFAVIWPVHHIRWL